jgi:hypothetical protein
MPAYPLVSGASSTFLENPGVSGGSRLSTRAPPNLPLHLENKQHLSTVFHCEFPGSSPPCQHWKAVKKYVQNQYTVYPARLPQGQSLTTAVTSHLRDLDNLHLIVIVHTKTSLFRGKACVWILVPPPEI